MYPGRLGCPNVGWSFAVDTSQLVDGVHLLSVTALSSEGWQSTSTSTFSVANLINDAIQFAIDQPSPLTGAVNGLAGIAGWAFSNYGSIKDILISIDGVSYGPAIYGLSRPDVTQAYPMAVNAGWSFTLDTTRLSNGPHRLSVTFEPDLVRKGTASTWFTVANPPAN
jgi:hypothetical protein